MIESLTERVAKLEQHHAELKQAHAELKQEHAELTNRVSKVEVKINAQLILHVQTDIAAGMKSKAVAEKHHVKANFVSVVAPRRQFAPGTHSRLH